MEILAERKMPPVIARGLQISNAGIIIAIL